jgi:hypothetical protein
MFCCNIYLVVRNRILRDILPLFMGEKGVILSQQRGATDEKTQTRQQWLENCNCDPAGFLWRHGACVWRHVDRGRVPYHQEINCLLYLNLTSHITIVSRRVKRRQSGVVQLWDAASFILLKLIT